MSYKLWFRSILTLALLGCAAGCPFDTRNAPPLEAAAAGVGATHTGLVSIQDVSIAGLPQAGHGLTFIASFTRLRRPTYEEIPGSPFGCKVAAFSLADEPPPTETDQGEMRLSGIRHGAIMCRFREGQGYVCPTAHGDAQASVAQGSGVATYTLAGLQPTAADVGRYLRVSGAARAQNNGVFPILGASADGFAVGNTSASEERFEAQFTILAAAGPTPRDLYSPFAEQTPVALSLEPGGARNFAAFEVELTPGAAFRLDTPSERRIAHVEAVAEPLTLGCDGEGGECGPASASVVRITTTDAALSGVGPTAMPTALHESVEITCASQDTGHITIPAEAMALLQAAHARSPITRIRTAFMREGFAQVGPATGNRVIVLMGHGIVGFSKPE